jgi:hypothetical protein
MNPSAVGKVEGNETFCGERSMIQLSGRGHCLVVIPRCGLSAVVKAPIRPTVGSHL